MAGPLGRKWPTPIARPLMPFFVAGAVIFYGVNNFAGLLSTTMFKDDPRNPALRGGPIKKEEH